MLTKNRQFVVQHADMKVGQQYVDALLPDF
jgi:hypothetical protein